jgi:hypothetical protein
MCAGAGAGFICGGCTGVGMCCDGVCCKVSAGVGLGLGKSEVTSASAGVGAGECRGCNRMKAGNGRNVESSMDMLGACVTMGYEDAGKQASRWHG